ncbi:MAG: hypothetical protein D6734_09700 [Candidatus Schekmanbacteria bacterium]|nr:MAG: hypothetical protein D6734_09700 [Candidatus Schekmanbacteria bacterium]
MKIKRILLRLSLFLISLILIFFLSGGVSNAKVKLKSKGSKLCFKCHKKMALKLKAKKYLHNPVAAGQCEKCHNPHTSVDPKLLKVKSDELCLSCHTEKKKEFAKNTVHPPVREGNCLGCHDPHGSSYRFFLKNTGSSLCFSCHIDLKMKNMESKHPPFKLGQCIKCHRPHASAERSLLRKAPKNLCRSCHNIGSSALISKHWKVNLKEVNCTLCHDPHGTQNLKLVKDVVHPPFEDRECDACHSNLAKDPRLFVEEGKDLCLQCHGEMEEVFNNSDIHPPVAQGKCISCHTPHASSFKKLLVDKERYMCLNCHTEKKKQFQNAKYSHPEKAGGGKCTICHTPHSSQQKYLFKKEILSVCTGCHKTQGTFTHPVGVGVIDPRDKKSQVTCVSCHEVHGSNYEYFLRGDRKRDLCVMCHQTAM